MYNISLGISAIVSHHCCLSSKGLHPSRMGQDSLAESCSWILLKEPVLYVWVQDFNQFHHWNLRFYDTLLQNTADLYSSHYFLLHKLTRSSSHDTSCYHHEFAPESGPGILLYVTFIDNLYLPAHICRVQSRQQEPNNALSPLTLPNHIMITYWAILICAIRVLNCIRSVELSPVFTSNSLSAGLLRVCCSNPLRSCNALAPC